VETKDASLKCEVSRALQDEFRQHYGFELKMDMAVEITGEPINTDEEGKDGSDGLITFRVNSIVRPTVPVLLVRGSRAMFRIAKRLARDLLTVWEHITDSRSAEAVYCVPGKDFMIWTTSATEDRFENMLDGLLGDVPLEQVAYDI
jgi:hypothetical protein